MNRSHNDENDRASKSISVRNVEVSSLRANVDNAFLVSPNAAARDELAHFLDLVEIRKLRFQGTISAQGRKDWRLEGTLGATVVQSCVVTSVPVTTRIDAAVSRLYMNEADPTPTANEIEFEGNDEVEPLGDQIDLWQTMQESLALELPQYPHAPGVEPGDFSISPPGSAPILPEETKPFASLAELRDKLSKKQQ